jgi:hypothetical protein
MKSESFFATVGGAVVGVLLGTIISNALFGNSDAVKALQADRGTIFQMLRDINERLPKDDSTIKKILEESSDATEIASDGSSIPDFIGGYGKSEVALPPESDSAPKTRVHAAKPRNPIPNYKVIQTVLVRDPSKTKYTGMRREIRLPFVPQPGMVIDIFPIRSVSWSTNVEAFIVSHPTLDADDAAALVNEKAGWKKNTLSEKDKP